VNHTELTDSNLKDTSCIHQIVQANKYPVTRMLKVDREWQSLQDQPASLNKLLELCPSLSKLLEFCKDTDILS